MTFLAYLAAQGDANAVHLREDLSGLTDGADDLAAMVAHLRSAFGGSEAVLAVEETVWRWKEWRKIEDRHAQVVAGLKNLKYLRRTQNCCCAA